MDIDLADLLLATVAWLAQHWWRAHEFLVRAGFDESRLLPGESRLGCTNPMKRRVKADHRRVQTTAGFR
jgi:hypothetical protein